MRASLAADSDNQAHYDHDPRDYASRFGLGGTWADPSALAEGTHLEKSPIHGHGLYANKPMRTGEVVSDMFHADKPTAAGAPGMTDTAAMVNASTAANLVMVVQGGQHRLVTRTAVEPGDELTADYPNVTSGVWHGTERE